MQKTFCGLLNWTEWKISFLKKWKAHLRPVMTTSGEGGIYLLDCVQSSRINSFISCRSYRFKENAIWFFFSFNVYPFFTRERKTVSSSFWAGDSIKIIQKSKLKSNIGWKREVLKGKIWLMCAQAKDEWQARICVK